MTRAFTKCRVNLNARAVVEEPNLHSEYLVGYLLHVPAKCELQTRFVRTCKLTGRIGLNTVFEKLVCEVETKEDERL